MWQDSQQDDFFEHTAPLLHNPGPLSHDPGPSDPKHNRHRGEHPMDNKSWLEQVGLPSPQTLWNLSPSQLYEHAVLYDGAEITSVGALMTSSDRKTGRSPKDKRIVQHADSSADVCWGDVNIPIDEPTYLLNRQRAIEFLAACERLYIVDGYAGWDPRYRLKIRIVCARPYHALFMYNMLMRPTPEELETFGEPDYVIHNAGQCAADAKLPGMTSDTSVDLSFERRELVILGTQYAGEMKKGVFTVMHYLMPKAGVLSMHCSANEGDGGDVSIFFGLSGTGKTTLSADDRRALIGDDEHCWSDDGVFNIEGGCYAKCVRLSRESEPELYGAVKFGTVLENTVFHAGTRDVDFDDISLTQNTRASYPIQFIPNAKIPCVGGHPRNVILLTCDAFGVLPPVSKLTPAQAMYHFVSGYTAKVAGTEMGVTEPEATFSACYGAAFLVWHPTKYAELLAERMREHGSQAWLINTGWTGGAYGDGSRIKLAYTRAIIDAIHSGALDRVASTPHPVFGVAVPESCPDVPAEVLNPEATWADRGAYRAQALKLAGLFRDHFAHHADQANEEILAAAPSETWNEPATR
jgi:phosphoenolpyruvate carboxykinase (ATP)